MDQAIPHVTTSLSRSYNIPLDSTPPSSEESSIAARGSLVVFCYLGSQALSQELVEEEGGKTQVSLTHWRRLFVVCLRCRLLRILKWHPSGCDLGSRLKERTKTSLSQSRGMTHR